MHQIPPSLEIHLFGTPGLYLNGQAVDQVRRKNRALVYYLAAHPQPVTRETLLAFFWPDHERTSAQPILRTMIHDLRKHLADSFHIDDSSMALASDTNIDAQTFSTLLQSPITDLQKLKDALSLYKGDFLDGFSLADSPQFDDWATSERERYRLMAMHGYNDLSRHFEGMRDYASALDAIQHALAFNTFQEDIQRDVMRLLYLNGDRAGVIRQYETLRKLLDEEMGVPPMIETRNLYDSIINDTFINTSGTVGTQFSISLPESTKSILPFVGRESELEKLKGNLGSGKLILLEGEPGIGKTRLISELIDTQVQAKKTVLVLQGVAHELEQNLPYQPIIEALRSLFTKPEWKSLSIRLDIDPIWLTELTRLLPELLTQFPHIPVPSQPVEESRLWESLLQFFHALSRRATVWLFLDDLHWADTSTIGWLGYFVRHISSLPFVVLATSRPIKEQVNLTKLFQTLARNNQLVHLPIPELTASAMQKMATALSPKHDEQLSGWLMENAEGNPFFLTELVRYAFDIGLLKTDGTLHAELFNTSPVLPPTIQNLIASRLIRLSETARHILHLAAIIGREFDFALLQRVAELSESDILDAIEELQATHLIKALEGDKFVFDHSLTMQVTLNDMSEARQYAYHRQVGEALESIYQAELDPVAGLIAHHFVDGNLPARAAAYEFRAGQFAATLAAWVQAIAFYEQALTLEKDNLKCAPIYLAMGTTHFHKADFALASKDFQSAVNLAKEKQNWLALETAHLALNQSFLPQARFAEAIALATELRESGPLELAICAEFMLGTSLTGESAKPIQSEAHLREAERLLLQHADYSGSITLPQITYVLASAVGQQGRSLDAIELYRKVLDMLDQGLGTLDIL